MNAYAVQDMDDTINYYNPQQKRGIFTNCVGVDDAARRQ